jgi:hypothetical protein
VLLGSIVSRSGRDDNAIDVANTTVNTPSEPLAELGVAPGAADVEENKSTNKQ